MASAKPLELDREAVEIPFANVTLNGDLVVPRRQGPRGRDAIGVVLFAHGSGSSRHSSRNRFVAEQLQEANLATLLMDLLTRDEEAVDQRTRHLRFDIPLLADRLAAATDWVVHHLATLNLPVGYFGASTGGGAALVAATQRTNAVGAVVSRGGRPDLAGSALPHVRAPTLLIVGGNDEIVIDLNRQAMGEMSCPRELRIVEGAIHLFEEPGTLEQVAVMARDWFLQHLPRQKAGYVLC